jgi:hypothetical protein
MGCLTHRFFLPVSVCVGWQCGPGETAGFGMWSRAGTTYSSSWDFWVRIRSPFMTERCTPPAE